ncbi:hypothetical protein BDV12DRAFT_167033 [Aspergillus spectabilis]
MTSAFRQPLSGRTILPVLLNILSGSALIAGIANKSKAKIARYGHTKRLSYQNANGSSTFFSLGSFCHSVYSSLLV